MKMANETIKQLGGFGRLSSMVNARNIMTDGENSFTLQFSGCKKANRLKITLDRATDTYEVELIFVGRLSRKTFDIPVRTHKHFVGLHAEQLREVFERHTGLLISL